jgi:hypothetical protein
LAGAGASDYESNGFRLVAFFWLVTAEKPVIATQIWYLVLIATRVEQSSRSLFMVV